MDGIFVCIEGIDGSGKTTQANILAKKLTEAGKNISLFSYPTHDSIYGKIIRDDFLAGKIEMSVEEQFLLYLLDMQSDKKKILNALSTGNIVMSERYFISTIAYQSAGNFDYEKAKAVEELMSLPRPDIIFYIDIEPEIAFERKKRQKQKTDRFESAREYINKVRNVYEKLYFERYGGKTWIRIDGTQNEEDISNFIFTTILNTIKKEKQKNLI
ncbi:MAG: dTMP kinase [Candidatus Micrarchaeaceae archaeon]